MQKKINGIICVLLAGSLWGVMGLFINHLNNIGIVTMQTVFIRMLFTALLMFSYLIIFNRKLLIIKLKDLWCFIGNGILSLLMFSFCYFNCIRLSSMAKAAVLLYTAPVIVMFFSIFLFKEKLNINKIIACVLCVIGCVLVSGIIGESGKISYIALLFGLGAGFGYALYTVFTRLAINRGYHPLTVITYSFFIGFIGSVPLTDIKGIFITVSKFQNSIPIIILMALVTSVFPYLLYTYGLTFIESSKASIIASIEPVVAALSGFFILKQNLDTFSILGITSVVLSLIILNTNFKGKKLRKIR